MFRAPLARNMKPVPLTFAALVSQTADPQVAVLLYIGPDVFLPLTSALAAIVGVVLVFWQKVASLAGRLWRMLQRDR